MQFLRCKITLIIEKEMDSILHSVDDIKNYVELQENRQPKRRTPKISSIPKIFYNDLRAIRIYTLLQLK
mgnify:CR=1 FL=1